MFLFNLHVSEVVFNNAMHLQASAEVTEKNGVLLWKRCRFSCYIVTVSARVVNLRSSFGLKAIFQIVFEKL